MNDHMTVAQTIRSQIQTPVLWALGAHQLSATTEDGKPGLTCSVRVLPFRKDGTRASRPRIMRLFVLLNGLDYYDIKVTYLNKFDVVEHVSFTDVDVFSLNRVLLSIDSMDDRP